MDFPIAVPYLETAGMVQAWVTSLPDRNAQVAYFSRFQLLQPAISLDVVGCFYLPTSYSFQTPHPLHFLGMNGITPACITPKWPGAKHFTGPIQPLTLEQIIHEREHKE